MKILSVFVRYRDMCLRSIGTNLFVSFLGSPRVLAFYQQKFWNWEGKWDENEIKMENKAAFCSKVPGEMETLNNGK